MSPVHWCLITNPCFTKKINKIICHWDRKWIAIFWTDAHRQQNKCYRGDNPSLCFQKSLKKILWLKLHFKEVPVENYKQILLNNKPTVPVLFAPHVYCCIKYIGPKGRANPCYFSQWFSSILQGPNITLKPQAVLNYFFLIVIAFCAGTVLNTSHYYRHPAGTIFNRIFHFFFTLSISRKKWKF